MSGRGLLSRLSSGHRRSDPTTSVAEHLRTLLNSRNGLSATVPGYGLVDFNDVVHNFPDGVRVIQHSIRDAILRYEPRLQNVSVRHVESSDGLTLAFEIVGRLADDRRSVVRLRTQLNHGGVFSVG